MAGCEHIGSECGAVAWEHHALNTLLPFLDRVGKSVGPELSWRLENWQRLNQPILCLRGSSSYVFLLVDNVGPDKFAVGKILEGRGQHKHASLKALKLRPS